MKFIIISLFFYINCADNSTVTTNVDTNTSNGVNTNIFNIFGGLKFTPNYSDSIITEAFNAWTANSKDGDACLAKEKPSDAMSCASAVSSSNFNCCQVKTKDDRINVCLPTTSKLIKLVSDISTNYDFQCSGQYVTFSVIFALLFLII